MSLVGHLRPSHPTGCTQHVRSALRSGHRAIGPNSDTDFKFFPQVPERRRARMKQKLTREEAAEVEAATGGRAPSVQQALSARSGGGLAAAWARGVQAGAARVAGCVFEGLRN